VGNVEARLIKTGDETSCDVSNFEDLLERNIVYRTANRIGVLPEFAEMSRTTVTKLAKTLDKT
jgi:hypothetical protein